MQDEAYWENLVKRSLCRFLLLAELAKGPVHGYGLNAALKEACQGCCQPTEAMVYTTMKELVDGGYLECRTEERKGRQRRVCWLSATGEEAFRAAARVWEKMLPKVQETVASALATAETREPESTPDATPTAKSGWTGLYVVAGEGRWNQGRKR